MVRVRIALSGRVQKRDPEICQRNRYLGKKMSIDIKPFEASNSSRFETERTANSLPLREPGVGTRLWLLAIWLFQWRPKTLSRPWVGHLNSGRVAKWILGLVLTLPALPAAASCVPAFPYRDGWLGGDFGLSIPRDAGHSVWLFGDTFVGDPAHGSRVNSAMVPNTVGISSCRGNDWSIYYYRGKDGASGTARPIFDTGTDQFRYWPLDGFLEAQRLYVFLVDITITGNRPFDFKEIGASLAEVTNPQAEPDRWNIQYRRLSPDAGLAVGVSAVVQFPYVYLYAVADRIAPGEHQVILARLPLDHLDSPATSVEYLTAHGTWKKGLDQKDARVLVDAGAPDFSVRFHPALWKWVMVQTDSAFPAREIGIRTADRLAGPWSSFRALYDIPEMPAASRPADVFSYAAKEHLEF
jgi:hypothetical protein